MMFRNIQYYFYHYIYCFFACARLTERFNQTLVTHLMKVVSTSADDWDEHIESVLFGYRINVQGSTKFSPFQLLYGVKPRLPIDMADVTDCTPDDDGDDERIQRATEFACGLAEVRNKAKQNLSAAQGQQKKRYDIKHAPPTYKVGDKVLKYNRRRDTRMGDKLQPRYTGPFQIVEVLGRGVYRLQDGEVTLKQSVNATNLKLWVDRSPQSSPEATPTKRLRQGSKSPSPKIASSADVEPTSTDEQDQPIVVDENTASPATQQTPATPWLHELNLTAADKAIIVDGEWLNDKIVDAANRIAASHLTLAAPQTSLLVQSRRGFTSVRADETNMQIMYDWAHWITAACVNCEVFVANSADSTSQIARCRSSTEAAVLHVHVRRRNSGSECYRVHSTDQRFRLRCVCYCISI